MTTPPTSIKHMQQCWICGKVMGQSSQPYGDCGAQDAQHQAARNPPPKKK